MNKYPILVLAVALGFFIGCSEKATEPTTETTGTFVLRMIDAPGDYDAVNIVVDSVQIHAAAWGDSALGWVTLDKTPKTYDLLKLVNGASEVIGSADLAPGHYSQLRLFIGAGSNVVVDGVTHTLFIPSGAASGLKLNINAVVEAGIRYEWYLDFDAARSIDERPNNYILQPVIRVQLLALTGTISGTVLPGAARPTIWAVNATDTVTTVADTTGAFKLMLVPPGTYSVHIVPADAQAYRDTLLTSKTVVAGQNLPLGTIQLATP